jgi:gas vesicle protein
MKRSVNEYDENRGGGIGGKLAEAAVPLGGLAGAAGMVGATKMVLDKPKQGKADREAAAEMKRESRGVKKPANFDAIEESKQDAKDAAARKKISDMGYAKGGMTASKRADGCCIKGKTRGKMV